MSTDDIQAAIIRAANDAGVNPAFALAVADRESSFNPHAHADQTIHGIYQMSRGLRDQYGIGDSEDPYTNARGWMAFQADARARMKPILGRDPTDAETYMAHYWGPGRAARMVAHYGPDTPTAEVFTPHEMDVNPEFGRAGTTGRLMASIQGDIDKRTAKFGGASSGAGGGVPDFSAYGDLPEMASPSIQPSQSPSASQLPDFSAYGEESA